MEEDSLTLPACRCMLTAAARQDWQQHQQQGLNTQKARTAPERGKRGRRCRRTKRRRARAGDGRGRVRGCPSCSAVAAAAIHSLTHSPLATGSKSNWILHATAAPATATTTTIENYYALSVYARMDRVVGVAATAAAAAAVVTQGLAYVRELIISTNAHARGRRRTFSERGP